MRSPFAGVVAAGLFVTLAACSAGSGSPVDTTAGPDGTPKASGDPSGPSGDSPGGIFGDLPPASGDQPGSSSDGSGQCLRCSGSYVCTTAGSTDTSHVTLVPAAGGCAASDANEVLLCNGDFSEASKGQSTVIGRWTGNNSSFTVTVVLNGQTFTATCVPGSGGSTVTPTDDAGTDDTTGS